MRGHNVHLSQFGRLDCTFCRQDGQNVQFNRRGALWCTFFQED
jgi:hypothetical protein